MRLAATCERPRRAGTDASQDAERKPWPARVRSARSSRRRRTLPSDHGSAPASEGRGAGPGAAGKAANLTGESPGPSIARFGRLAYLMHAKVTTHVLLRSKRHGRLKHRKRCSTVGTTWVASKLGGLKSNE